MEERRRRPASRAGQDRSGCCCTAAPAAKPAASQPSARPSTESHRPHSLLELRQPASPPAPAAHPWPPAARPCPSRRRATARARTPLPRGCQTRPAHGGKLPERRQRCVRRTALVAPQMCWWAADCRVPVPHAWLRGVQPPATGSRRAGAYDQQAAGNRPAAAAAAARRPWGAAGLALLSYTCAPACVAMQQRGDARATLWRRCERLQLDRRLHRASRIALRSSPMFTQLDKRPNMRFRAGLLSPARPAPSRGHAETACKSRSCRHTQSLSSLA